MSFADFYQVRLVTKSVHTKSYTRFLELLITARKNAKVTQDEVAERLNRPQSFVSKYENGERRVDVIEFLDIAQAIGFDPISFMRKVLKSR
jgi:transcriptional regulator with XRE-family HTH domain